MNAIMPSRFPGWTAEHDRAAMTADLPSAQQAAEAECRSVMGLFEEEVAAVEIGDHPSLTWFDYRETECVERALREAWATFARCMGRTQA